MKFKLENPLHQITAIQSVVEVFRSMEKNTYGNAHIEDIHSNVCSLSSVALTRNLRYIRFIIEKHCEEMMVLGYTQKLNKLLSVYKDSDSWTLLDLRYAFNYLYYIAQTLKQNGESNDAIDFWIEDAFVRKFVVE